MQELLKRLHERLAALSIDPKFAPPATDEELRAAEEALCVAFPSSLRELYLCANGQLGELWSYETEPIVPRFRFAPGWEGLSAWGWLCPLARVVELTQLYREEMDENGCFEWDDEGVVCHGPAKAHKSYIQFTDADDPLTLALDLQPEPGGAFGQVVTLNEQPNHIAVIAPSLEAFFEMMVEGYGNGRFTKQKIGNWSEA